MFIQISQLFHQYLNQSLVTNIEFSSKHAETLPAITICYDKIFSFYKMAQRFHPSSITEKFLNYRKFIYSADIDHGNNKSENIHEKLKSYENFYFDKVNWIIESVRNRSIDLHDMFENLTLPFSFSKKSQPYFLVTFFGQILLGSSEIVNPFIYDNISTYHVSYPVESIFRTTRKCFTFFSDLHKEYRNLKITDKEILFIVKYPRYLFPFGLNRKLFVSVHSPKELPRKFSFIELDQAHGTTITYNRIENKHEHNYFKCQDYSSHDKYKIKPDCYIDCMMNILSKTCQDYYNFMEIIKYPIRKDLLPVQYPYYNCPNGTRSSSSSHQECMYQCPDDCDQKYFFIQSANFPLQSYNFDRDKILTSHSLVQILSSNLPTIILNHLPEMTLISLLCNLGGLIGMWLGISIASTFEKLVNLIKVSITNLYSSSITNNTKINIPSLTFNLNVLKIFQRNRSPMRNNINNSW